MPFFRVHCTLYAPRQEPWSFGRPALELARVLLRRRYRLLPLLYRLALEEHETGLPIVRPLFMHFDVPRRDARDHFLLGDRVLVAPVLDNRVAQREVWLPPGRWTHWLTGQAYEGGRRIVVDAPLAMTPIFVRDGTALFVAAHGINSEETLGGPMTLEVYPPLPGSTGTGSLFLDDGESDSASRFILDVSMRDAGGELVLGFDRRVGSFVPKQQCLELRLRGAYRSVVVDGVRIALGPAVDGSTGRLSAMAAARITMAASEVVCERGDLRSQMPATPSR
jgi:alpha-glucosidase